MSLIWMQDYALYNLCRLEAQRRNLSGISDVVALFVQQELGVTKPFSTPDALYIACVDATQSHNGYNVAGFMEHCCRKGLGLDVAVQHGVVQTQVQQSDLATEEPKRKLGRFSLPTG